MQLFTTQQMGPGNRPLDLDWLEDFVAVSETGNFSRAAEARAIAQPALSRHIRALEEWVGVDLLDRTAHPVGLTAAGQSFLPQVAQLLSALEAARIKAKDAHDQNSVTLRFASTHALSLTFFPRWLAMLETRLRLGPVQTLSDSFRDCEDLMYQRRVQFLLCYGHPAIRSRLDDDACPMVTLGQDMLLPVSAPDASGQALHRLDAPDPLPLLTYGDASALGRILAVAQRDWRHDAQRVALTPRSAVAFTAHNAFLLKAMALEGRGMAWLPQSLVREELDGGTLCIAGDTRWHVPLEVRMYRQKSAMSALAEALWQACAHA